MHRQASLTEGVCGSPIVDCVRCCVLCGLQGLWSDGRGGGPCKVLVFELARAHLEPQLKKHNLQWSEISPLLESVDTYAELQNAAQHPEAFLQVVGWVGGCE